MTESDKQMEKNLEEVRAEAMAAESDPPEIAPEPEETPTDAVETPPESAAASDEAAEAVADIPSDFESLELEGEGDETISPAAAQVEALTRELQALRGQVEDRNTQYLRITADFENFRKRTRKEQDEQEERIKCATILELLPVIDNFERARVQLKAEGEEAVNIHKSYQGIYKQLVDCLKRIGVAPMRAEGKEFDPMLHEAVMREPTDAHPDGTVIEELQRGYVLGERVLRHAMVRVAVAPEPTAPAEEISEDA